MPKTNIILLRKKPARDKADLMILHFKLFLFRKIRV
jgi:hypothetical protein